MSNSKKIMKFNEPDNIVPSDLTASQQDILALVLTSIGKQQGTYTKFKKISDAKKENNEPYKVPEPLVYDGVFEYTENELMDLFNCDIQKVRSTFYDACNALQSRQIRRTTQEKGKKTKKSFVLFSSFDIIENNGLNTFKIFIHPEIVNEVAEYQKYSVMDFKMFISLNTSPQKSILVKPNRTPDFVNFHS